MRMVKELTGFLRANQDVFTWTYSNMCGISLEIALLNVYPNYVPMKKKCHNLSPERFVVKEEADKLKDNGFICDALYPK